MDYRELLRRLTINDQHLGDDGVLLVGSGELDAKTLALARVAALVAVGGAVPSYGAEAAAAVDAGASAAEIVEVLIGIRSIVGQPSLVAAAPCLAVAIGYNVDEALEQL